VIVAFCDRCRQEVADGDGCISVRYRDIDRARRQRQRAMKILVLARVLRISVESDWLDFIRTKPSARWSVHHYACSRSTADTYWIDVRELRTRADLMEWTGHLVRKEWLTETDWPQVLIGAIYGGRGRLEPRPTGLEELAAELTRGGGHGATADSVGGVQRGAG
jgi:hypothetical protein